MEKAENPTKNKLDFNRVDYINKNIEPYLVLSVDELNELKKKFQKEDENPNNNAAYKLIFIQRIFWIKEHIALSDDEYKKRCKDYEELSNKNNSELTSAQYESKLNYGQLKSIVEELREKEAIKRAKNHT